MNTNVKPRMDTNGFNGLTRLRLNAMAGFFAIIKR